MGRVTEKKRVVNACSRCRQHKIKCSGICPCNNCLQRKVNCKFEGEEAKVYITKKHLSELKQRNLELEERNGALQQQLSAYAKLTPNMLENLSPPTETESPLGMVDEPRDSIQGDEAALINTLACGPPKYITDGAGRPHFLGHTSNWSLTIRLLHLTHQALYKCPYPTAAHHIDSMTYILKWDGLRSPVVPDIRRLPTLDQAVFLINTTKFHTGQVFHLFDEESFMIQLQQFYEEPKQDIHTESLWFIHFLVLIALGKAFVGARANGVNPPGAEYFTTAFMMLPDYSFFWKDPCTSAELLCSMALYMQSIDWRTSAHNLIGQALRMLQVHGFHTNISSISSNKDLLRYQNVWWTVYVLERQLSVLMGVPCGFSDNNISAFLPQYQGSETKTATVAIHVKLSQALSNVVNAIYRENGDLNSTLVKATQDVLQQVADVASDLREKFPLPNQESRSGISRVSGYLHLLYHQCIMLAIRPFLFGLVETSVSSGILNVAVPTPIQILLQICLESAKNTVCILNALCDQTLLECFLPFDLESAVSAGLVVTMATLVCPNLIESPSSVFKALSALLDHIENEGNLIAASNKRELADIHSLCLKLKSAPSMALSSQIAAQLEEGLNLHSGASEIQPGEDVTLGEALPSHWAEDMTPSQLLEVVDLLNEDNILDWVDFPTNAVDNELSSHIK
ncbi:Zn(II)2Cys6 transcription factor [Aspergillus luchuensis]|uniref:Zn(2)-C6 fungal-type domain-containing protein n=1 Tax=Aspergillus kawachii TaxID=1069201 RepID=A0A7R7WFI4_ASPKA|nr:uncharacterized protein AKAW2_60004A [Aspergillus luchuensis]BCS01740.1 hypothetical protein AKAW2_60004A [Aspergillus luchuensis]GAA92141.1 Zn(II)2Cys6 transcription factor [Aspergillus luchuensis IFO 4308]